MTFFEVLCSNLFSFSMTALFFMGVAILLLGPVPYRDKTHSYMVMGALLAYIVLVAFASTAFYKTGMYSWPYGGGEILLQYIQIFGNLFLIKIMYGKTGGTSLAVAVFLLAAYDFGWNLEEIFAPDKYYHLDNLAERWEYLFHEWVAIPLALVFTAWLLCRLEVGKLYRQWERKKPGAAVLVFLGLYPILSQALQELVERFEKIEDFNPVTAIIFLLVIYLIFMHGAREEMHREQIEAQQVSLQQQAVYIENLEGLQREVRRFRHDFKNMMAGMYVQAREGDLDAVQSYIQEMTTDFDMQVGSQIRLMNQLANIHMAEVKGLFLEKLKEMQKQRISCELEVQRPFGGTAVRSTDLCRCLGILLDNAMEEVRGREEGKIHIMISSQDGCTTFRVKNTLFSSPDFPRIGTLGYSTKGEGRGIGLANYRKILERYEQALPLTAVQDGYFVQELKVREGS